MFIGDGSLGFVFNESKSRAPIFYFKPVFSFVCQKRTNYNTHLLNLIAKYIKLEPKLSHRADMICLEYSGNIIFEKILPLLAEYKDWLYWRKNTFELLLLVADIYKEKEHLTKIGYIKILNLLYSVANKYFKPKEYWLDLLEKRTWK